MVVQKQFVYMNYKNNRNFILYFVLYFPLTSAKLDL